MSNCIRGGSGSDVASLDIADHKESLVLAILDRAGIYFKTLNAKLLIHCNLRFH